jgi:hypothetical protein
MADLASAAFDRHGYEVTAGPFRVAVPFVSADRWALALCRQPHRSSVLALLPDESQRRVDEWIMSGRLDTATLDKLVYGMIAGAGGRPWYQARMLVHTAMGSDGRLLGMLLLRGVRAQELSLAEFCAAIWAVCTENASPMDLMKMEAQLSVPPVGVAPEGFDEIDDFQAMAERMRSMPGVRVG